MEKFSKLKGFFIDKTDTDKPQRFHLIDTPRIGGLGIIISFLIIGLLLENTLTLKLFIASLPIAMGGFLEDLGKRVKPEIRLALAFLSAILFIVLTGSVITTLGFAPLNKIPFAIAFLFTVFTVSGVTNSINIIDGFNGLASGFSLITLVVFAVISYQLHDNYLFNSAVILAFSVLGFFILNFPFGKIFLGDGGAYFLGFSLAEFSVLLVKRHPSISPWFCLVLMIYPVWEVLFSFYRRRVLKGISSMYPDKMHFHSVIYRTMANSNYQTTLFVLPIIIIFDIAAYFTKNRTSLSMILIFAFIAFYNMVYHALVWRKHPLLIRKKGNKKQ